MLNYIVCTTKSHKPAHFSVDMCNKSHIVFPIKYINNSLQTISKHYAFPKKIPNEKLKRE